MRAATMCGIKEVRDPPEDVFRAIPPRANEAIGLASSVAPWERALSLWVMGYGAKLVVAAAEVLGAWTRILLNLARRRMACAVVTLARTAVLNILCLASFRSAWYVWHCPTFAHGQRLAGPRCTRGRGPCTSY